MSYLQLFKKAVLAGVMISIGGTVYLMCEINYVGALLFSLGLFTILAFELKLFTGAIGYAPQKGLWLIWLGNLVGTVTGGLALSFTRLHISEKAAAISAVKLGDSPISSFILAIFCGALMFIAVDAYKNKGTPIGIFLAVPVFILCGFEHCVANMFYFTVGGAWSLTAVLYLLIMTAGNAVGAIALYRLTKTT